HAPTLSQPPFPARRSSDLRRIADRIPVLIISVLGRLGRNGLAACQAIGGVRREIRGDGIHEYVLLLKCLGCWSGARIMQIQVARDRKSTRLNSSHVKISYA